MGKRVIWIEIERDQGVLRGTAEITPRQQRFGKIIVRDPRLRISLDCFSPQCLTVFVD